MPLVVPLNQKQLTAARRLYENHLSQWSLSETALLRLKELTPQFAPDVCLIKSVSLNAIYGTQVLAIVRMAKHVTEIMSNANGHHKGSSLVEAIADLPSIEGDKARKRTSFASKFCHFYVDPERFPIYDEAARETIKLHLGPSRIRDEAHPYTSFCKNFLRIRTEAKVGCTTRELDRYLWLTGMYMRWLKERLKERQIMNAELKLLFTKPTPVAAAELDAMLPPVLTRVFI